MTGAFQILSVRGIPIRVHYTLLLILPLLAWVFGQTFVAAADFADVPAQALRGSPFIWGLFVALGLFLGVLLHELAHSLYALSRGIPIHDITLMAIGGASHLADSPERPKDEAVMALVGPLASLAIAFVLFGLMYLVGASGSFNARFGLFYLGQLNLFLALFNLVPAFPMDGGRILRALLTPRFGPVRATQTAATVGKVFAGLFAVLGFLSGNFILLLIAFFVFFGAQAESKQVLTKAALGRMKVRELMFPRALSVHATTSVQEALQLMRQERRNALPVLSGEEVVGVVRRSLLSQVPAPERSQRVLREHIEPAVSVTPSDEAWEAVRKLANGKFPALVVVEAGRLVGSLDPSDVAHGLAWVDPRADEEAERWPMTQKEHRHA